MKENEHELYIVNFDGEKETFHSRKEAELAIEENLKDGEDPDYIEVTRGVEVEWDYSVRIND